jgi:LAO/AO transport system kinase
MKQNHLEELISLLHSGDRKALARCISIVENDATGSEEILASIKIDKSVPLIGITGPPGAGKSTLVSALVSEWQKLEPGTKIAVLAVDPTSPFTNGSLLGDRLRMSDHFNNPAVYIRSIATRGNVGGLSAKAIEITDVMRAAGFNYIFVETVGVGQSEVDIASMAETTVVVFVPESGDDVQAIKSGIMEIGDIFVVNKADRASADILVKNLSNALHERIAGSWNIPVIKTTATTSDGVLLLIENIQKHQETAHHHQHDQLLLYNKAVRLLQNMLLKKIDVTTLRTALESNSANPHFNLYKFLADFLSKA